jgi:hypothetical protein
MSRKLKRAFMRGLAQEMVRPHKGPCFKKGCKQNGGTIHHCVTCEKIRDAQGSDPITKVHEVFTVQCCAVHFDEGLKKIRRHAVTAHPVNLLRVVAAGLKGEQI